MLDIVFDNRNKDYGAYELRKSYEKRITKALIVTGCFGVLIFGGAVFASSMQSDKDFGDDIKVVELTAIDDPKPIIEQPEPEKQPEPEQPKTVEYTTMKVVDDDMADPIATQEDIVDAKVSTITQDGVPDEGIADAGDVDGNTGIIEDKKAAEPEIWTKVEVEARYEGNWEAFLRKYLDPEVPINNGAPAGRYTIEVQFVVDVDGTVSDIVAVTKQGFGMEEEAVRVLRKAKKWEPAFQNSKHVKAYRRQHITFEVLTD